MKRLGQVVFKYDVSLPLSSFYDIVTEMRRRFSSRTDVRVIGYGHLGDCNLHLNVSAPTNDPEVLRTIEPYVFEYVGEALRVLFVCLFVFFRRARAHPSSPQRPRVAVSALSTASGSARRSICTSASPQPRSP
jgi:hypothetical protein